jgi:hypothetical protein
VFSGAVIISVSIALLSNQVKFQSTQNGGKMQKKYADI